MDAKKKKTLDEFMAVVPEEELKTVKPSQVIMLDEPDRKLWLTVFAYFLIVVLVVGLGFFAYQELQKRETVSASEKIGGAILVDNKPVAKYVYVEAEGGANLRSSASTDSTLVALIPNKIKVEVLAEESGWLKVSSGDYTGWIRRDLTLQP